MHGTYQAATHRGVREGQATAGPWASAHEAVKGLIPRKMETPRLTDAGAGSRLRWSLDIVERCSDQ